ncbi:MAG TPA: hypothetical protein VHR35_14190 [Nocardioides sp.]|jgi:hypothetical protein|nr:hypothetical protein [Nocardioides sp.]
MRRTLGLTLAIAATAVATVLGLAGPAQAAYSTVPVSLPWLPAGAVHSSVSGNGVVYVGGKLDGIGGIAALDASTGSLLWRLSADNDVRALTLSADGTRLYAGGNFKTVGGQTAKHLAAVNVATHSVVTGWKGRAAGMVRDLVVRGNTLYVAGKITSVDGVAQRGMGAVDATTGLRVASFTFSADNDVLGLALAGTRLVISGSFTQVNGVPRASLASIDLAGNTLTTWSPARLCSSCTQYWDVQTDGTNAYVATSGNAGGAFNLTTGQQPWRIIRGDGDFQAVWLPGDGKVYYGGHFGQEIWSGFAKQNVVTASVVASVFISTGQIDTSWTPKIYHTYPGCWTFTSTAARLWVGGDFGGEQVNGMNNKKPFLAAYPGV